MHRNRPTTSGESKSLDKFKRAERLNQNLVVENNGPDAVNKTTDIDSNGFGHQRATMN